MNLEELPIRLPPAGQIRLAVELYLRRAYSGDSLPQAPRLVPPEDFDPAAWLMADPVERDPADAPLEQIRSFVLRLGNDFYPHMKLRISRPPRSPEFVFSVDSHDVFLHAPPGSPDYDALEDLKKRNAALAELITASWEAQSLPTERTYLRGKLQQAREAKDRH
jgi:hypothetical protein